MELNGKTNLFCLQVHMFRNVPQKMSRSFVAFCELVWHILLPWNPKKGWIYIQIEIWDLGLGPFF